MFIGTQMISNVVELLRGRNQERIVRRACSSCGNFFIRDFLFLQNRMRVSLPAFSYGIEIPGVGERRPLPHLFRG